MKESTKAVFVDLDHTLITTKSGRKFPIHSEDWKFIGDTLKTIKHFYTKGYRIIIVTNQGGIEEGYITEKIVVAKLNAVCQSLEKHLKLRKNCVSYFYCKHMESYNRKPNPGMGYEAALEYELELDECIMIGDTITDEEFARKAGIKAYYDVSVLKGIDWDNF